MTKLNETQKGEELDVDEKDIAKFFGQHTASRENLFWSNNEDFFIPIVATTMPRGWFKKLKKCFYIIDSSNLKSG